MAQEFDASKLPDCYANAAEYIGFGYQQVHFSLTVSEDGSAIITRDVTVVAYRTVRQLDQYLLVPVANYPLDRGVSVGKTSGPRSNTKVNLVEDLSKDGRRRIILLKINPHLRRTERLQYEILEPMKSGTVARLAKELEKKPKKQKENRFSYEVSWPTQDLCVNVTLPYRYAPVHDDADVWRGPSKISVEEVAKDVRDRALKVNDRLFIDGKRHYHLSLNIKYPQQGLVYALKWQPPPVPILEENDGGTMPESTGSGRIFLLHTEGDSTRIRGVYERLTQEGFHPWLSDLSLLPGQERKQEVRKAVRGSAVVLVALSIAFTREAGSAQSDLKLALDVKEEQPEGTIFLIPAKLEECDVPESLGNLQCVNLFEDEGWKRLVLALRKRLTDIEAKPG